MSENKSTELIERGTCPFCNTKVYHPSRPADSLAYHIAVGLHMAKCDKNPNKEESELDELMKRIFGDRG